MSKREINLQKNIQLCFNFGYRTLITANSRPNRDEIYRNAIISIHNGIELLMKYYLIKKEKLLIYNKINYQLLICQRTDLIQPVNPNDVHNHTITYDGCTKILGHFSKLYKIYNKELTQLNEQRNDCVHYEYSYNEGKLRKLLIYHIYQFICDLISEMGLELKEFISEKYTVPLHLFKTTIDDEIKRIYYEKIEAAKNHYFDELTEDDRRQKAATEDYGADEKLKIIVKCPACENNALLKKKIQLAHELGEYREIIRRNLILRDLSCHYCGLLITDYDQLKLQFKDEERRLPSSIVHLDYTPEDCPDDCAPEDCPDDCAPEDCPDDCAPEDCPDDCAPEDCPDDCAPEDCPKGLPLNNLSKLFSFW
ncbi:hypothetical protein BROC_00615 [Candidatus Brocadiaceae bacterium]|nr:hypothetical protein BROC_00615 [Candidatus Brocadiaceae bacterium]